MLNIKKFNKKIVNIDDIEKIYEISEYSDLVKVINKLIDECMIIPIKSSGGNGKKPTLYKRYRVVIEEDNSEILEEINYKLSSRFSTKYYEANLDKYIEHRAYILKLNEFFINKRELLNARISMNERAFQIWGREKFLQKENGKTILKNLGIPLEELNYYDTSEPLAYYSQNKSIPQNVLIIENKDTYYTMRNHLIKGNNSILGKRIDSIIYGGGKSLNKSFNDFQISVEWHVSNKENTFYYFGDLDYEGIVIYESFYERFFKEYNLRVFIEGYKMLIDKANKLSVDLPKTKEGQNRNIKDIFLKDISLIKQDVVNGKYIDYKLEIENILQNDLYIPQEIINIQDL